MNFLRKMKRTYRWHRSLTLEPSSDSIVDSLWFAPVWSHTHEHIGLMPIELLLMLLDDPDMLLCGHHLGEIVISNSWEVIHLGEHLTLAVL